MTALLVAGCTSAQQASAPPTAEIESSAALPATDSLPSTEDAVAAVSAAGKEPTPVDAGMAKAEAARDAPTPRLMPPPKTTSAPAPLPAQAPLPVPVNPPRAAVTPKATAPVVNNTAPAVMLRQTPAPVVVARPVAPPLDLAGLESRLRATKAIGVMTKLSLKNQVDDLLDRFRSQYRGRANAPLPELRAAYDRLLMKVLSLLQDADQALAKDIVSSREAIWGILSDPKKFSENNLMAGA
ncbi:MAG: hypothetical protein WAU48_12600 [Gammaproteobacteria bacterium]